MLTTNARDWAEIVAADDAATLGPIGYGWTEATGRAYELAVECARGRYQRNLLAGREALSGSTLQGTAKKYGVHYAVSRSNLLARVRRAGVDVSERRGPHGKRVLVLTLAA
jgi:hypothetical protein